MRRIARCFRHILLPVAAAVGLAFAPAARAGTAWLCNLSEDAVHLICLADVDPTDDPPALGPAPVTTVRGTRFPLDPRQVYTIDLWSPPSEPDRLELLAQATLCYRSPGCTATVAGSSFEAVRRLSGGRHLARR